MTDRRSRTLTASSAAAAGLAALIPQAALAHHPMGGATPSTFVEGLLSGLGHPVLGPDHLAFIVGVGILMAASRRWAVLPFAFVALLVPGVLAHAAEIGIGPSELYVALSVVLVGAVLVVEPRLPAAVGIGLVALAGFCHGYAFGGTIVGSETTPIVAYLIGLSVVLVALTTGVAFVARALMAAPGRDVLVRQAAGVALVLAGGALTIGLGA